MGQTIDQVQAKIVEEFSHFPDWVEKYEYLIAFARELDPLPPEHRVDKNLIKGCQSRVWLHAEFREGVVHYFGDSDTVLVKGIVGLLLKVFSGHAPVQIAKANMDFFHQIGLGQHLSPNRANGLLAMARQIKFYAVVFQAKAARV